MQEACRLRKAGRGALDSRIAIPGSEHHPWVLTSMRPEQMPSRDPVAADPHKADDAGGVPRAPHQAATRPVVARASVVQAMQPAALVWVRRIMAPSLAVPCPLAYSA